MALPALLLASAAVTWAVDPSTTGVLVEDHRAEVVSVVLELPAGSWSPWCRRERCEEAFVLQDADTGRALRGRADALGASIDMRAGDRASSLSLTVLSGDLPRALALVKDILANRDYDRKEVVRSRRQRDILWRQTDTDVSFRLEQAVARALFEDADPRRIAWEQPERSSASAEALAAARDALLRLPGRLVGFAGDVTPEQARELARDLLPPPAAAPADLLPTLLPVRARGPEASIPIRKLTQVYFAVARDSIPWDDPRRPAFLVADHVLGGHFYSRLFVALRHEGGETYGAATSEDGDAAAGRYWARTFTRADNASATEAKLRETLRVFHDGGITEAERAAAVSHLAGSLGFARQSPTQILGRFRLERRNGLPPGSLDALVASAARLSLEEVNAFIREYYDPSAFSMFRAVPR